MVQQFIAPLTRRSPRGIARLVVLGFGLAVELLALSCAAPRPQLGDSTRFGVKVHWKRERVQSDNSSVSIEVLNHTSSPVLVVHTSCPSVYALGSVEFDPRDSRFDGYSYSGRLHRVSPYVLPELIIERLEPSAFTRFDCQIHRHAPSFLIEFGLVADSAPATLSRVSNLNGSRTYYMNPEFLVDIDVVEFWVRNNVNEGVKRIAIE